MGKMGKFESKKKTRKKMIQGAGKFLWDGLIILVGVVVITLLGLPDDPYTGQDVYAVGLIVIFLVAEAGVVIHRAIRKRKEKSLLREENVAEQSKVID